MDRKQAMKATGYKLKQCFMEMNLWSEDGNQKLRVQSQRPQKIITGKKDWAQIKEMRPVPGWISELQRTSGCILSSLPVFE